MTDGYGTRYQCINFSGAAVWSTYYGYELEPPIVAGNGDLYAACYNATAWKIDPATGATLPDDQHRLERRREPLLGR